MLQWYSVCCVWFSLLEALEGEQSLACPSRANDAEDRGEQILQPGLPDILRALSSHRKTVQVQGTTRLNTPRAGLMAQTLDIDPVGFRGRPGDHDFPSPSAQQGFSAFEFCP